MQVWHLLPSSGSEGGLGKLNQLLYPAGMKFKCPNCSGDIGYYDVLIQFGERWTRLPFRCPTCGSLLCVSRTYSWSVFLGCSLLALVIPAIVGIGAWFLRLGAAILVWLMLVSLAGAYVKILFPPRIIRYYSDDLSLNIR